MTKWLAPLTSLGAITLMVSLFGQSTFSPSPTPAKDPGVRPNPAGAGLPLRDLTLNQKLYFDAGLEAFSEVDSVQGTIANTEAGLGPTFNLDSCAGCHAHPAIGGTSPFVNPQIEVAHKAGALNRIPSFITQNGPVREARFQFNPDGSRDGGVHGLFTIAGRTDAPGCNLQQPDFAAAVAARNVVFRIPTPLFGSGLIEAISETTILNSKNDDRFQKQNLGISGRENRNGNDGTITRFGWKAQNKSLMLFAGEAYNVEQGITNEIFPHDRSEAPGCCYMADPESEGDMDARTAVDGANDLVLFSIFMRFLAPPTPAPATTSTSNGRALFSSIGCALCHTPSLQTGRSATAALNNKTANLFSDLLLHNMGSGLADDVNQGVATGSEFRTAPLWGLGQRIFFLHDGRTKDLLEAIRAHASTGSEASRVIGNFNGLPESQKQDLLNFLRSL